MQSDQLDHTNLTPTSHQPHTNLTPTSHQPHTNLTPTSHSHSTKQPNLRAQPKSRPPNRQGRHRVSIVKIKIEVAIEALRGNITRRELSKRFGVPQALIITWKDLALQSIRECFEKETRRGPCPAADELNRLLSRADLKTLKELTGPIRETADLMERLHMTMSETTDTSLGS